MMIKIFLILALLVCMPISFGIFTWTYSDDISKAALCTSFILGTQEFRNTDEVVKWLEKYHGEAPGHQVMITFSEWIIKNPLASQNIISALNDKTRERLRWAINDSNREARFLKVHKGLESYDLVFSNCASGLC